MVLCRATHGGSTGFSLRASRTFDLPVGRYLVHIRGDDGIRLRLNGIQVLDAWLNQRTSGFSIPLDHPGGSLRVELEYFQDAGDGVLDDAG